MFSLHYFHVHGAAVEGVVVYLIAVAVAGAGRVAVLIIEARVALVIVVQQHHLLVLVRALVVPAALAVRVVVVIIILWVILQLFQLVRVRCPYELSIHVEDLSLRIHQELAVVALDLNAAHDNIILHIHTDLLVRRLPAVVIRLSRLPVKTVTVFYQAVVVQRALRVVIVMIIVQTIRLILQMQRRRRVTALVVCVGHGRLLVFVVFEAGIISILEVAAGRTAATATPVIVVH